MFTTPLPDTKINQAARERLGDAIYLLAHLIRRADWKTGTLRTSRERIACETGFPADTVKRWIERLAEVGEITSRKTRNGAIITIIDYAAIARTRGVTKADRVKSDPIAGSEMIPDRSKNDPNHVQRILSQNIEKNSSQILSSLSSVMKELSSAPEQVKVDRRYESDADRQCRIAREWMHDADEDSQKEMIDKALESMENDSRPFVRIFVRRNQQGQREYTSHTGDEPLMTRIGLLLEKADGQT